MSQTVEPSVRQVRGDCGHLKASYDNHTDCRRCCVAKQNDCSQSNPCEVSSHWSQDTWRTLSSARSYASRKPSRQRSVNRAPPVPTVSQPTLSGSDSGPKSTRTDGPADEPDSLPSQKAISRPSTSVTERAEAPTGHRSPGTGHRSPVTGHRSPGRHPVSDRPSTGRRSPVSTSDRASTGHRAPGTGHRAPGTGQRSATKGTLPSDRRPSPVRTTSISRPTGTSQKSSTRRTSVTTKSRPALKEIFGTDSGSSISGFSRSRSSPSKHRSTKRRISSSRSRSRSRSRSLSRARMRAHHDRQRRHKRQHRRHSSGSSADSRRHSSRRSRTNFVSMDAFTDAIASINSAIAAIGKGSSTAPRPSRSNGGPAALSAAPDISHQEASDLNLDYEDQISLHPGDSERDTFLSEPVRPDNVPRVGPALGPPPPDGEPYGDPADQDAWSYHKLIDLAYELLPSHHCPPQPPPEVRVRSITEDLIGETFHQVPRLPHSSTVEATAKLLADSEAFVSGKKGFQVPAATMRKLAAPGAYNVHTPKWPTKPPTLDSDSAKIGIKATPNIQTTWHFIESAESKLRTSVSTLSHSDVFCAAAHMALVEGRDTDCVSSLIHAAAKSARHAMGTTMALSTELMMLRRDCAINASNVLPGENRERLRAAPLTSVKLFGGICASVAADDATQRQRDQLLKPVPSSARKGSSRPNPAKGKGQGGPRVPSTGARNPSPLDRRGKDFVQSDFRRRGAGRGQRRGGPSRGRSYPQNKPQKPSQ